MVRRRSDIGAVLLLTLAMSGCVTTRQLKPAFEANEKNVEDLVTNTRRIVDLVIVLAKTRLDDNVLRQKRETVLSLNSRYCSNQDSVASEAALIASLGDEALDPGKTYALAERQLAAATDEEKPAIYLEFPVSSALAAGKVTHAQVVQDCAIVLGGTVGNASVRNNVAKKYPSVIEAEKTKKAVVTALNEYRATVEQQGGLAEQHASLFVYAAEADVNINKAFKGVVGDDGLQGKVVSSLKDDTQKKVVDDIFQLLSSL